MEEERCKLYRGFVFRHVPESISTFYFYKTAEDYILRILKNNEVADALSGVTWEVIRLIEKPACQIITQMKIDYNFIEVKDGYYFDIENKCFVKNPKLMGSPRAFVLYNCRKRPNPRPFMEGKQFSKIEIYF